MDTTSRRWFPYSIRLRTLFLITALVGIWLAYHMNWIRQRHLALQWVARQAEYWDDMPVQQGAFPGANAPWRIRMLGEGGIESLCVIVEADEVDPKKQELRQLFPEAEVGVYTPGPGYRGKRAK